MRKFPLSSKVNNTELIKSLKISLERNENAIDYLENKISNVKDMLEYVEYDKVLNEELEILEHIKFSLSFLTDSYNKTLRGLL